MATSMSRGMSMLMFLRLCSRAPRMRMDLLGWLVMRVAGFLLDEGASSRNIIIIVPGGAAVDSTDLVRVGNKRRRGGTAGAGSGIGRGWQITQWPGPVGCGKRMGFHV